MILRHVEKLRKDADEMEREQAKRDDQILRHGDDRFYRPPIDDFAAERRMEFRKDAWILFQTTWIRAANRIFQNIPVVEQKGGDKTKPPTFIPKLVKSLREHIPKVIDLETFEPLPYYGVKRGLVKQMRFPGTSFLPVSEFERVIVRFFLTEMSVIGLGPAAAIEFRADNPEIVAGIQRFAKDLFSRLMPVDTSEIGRLLMIRPKGLDDPHMNFPQYTTLRVKMDERAEILGKEMKGMNERGFVRVPDMVLLVHNHLSRAEAQAILNPGEMLARFSNRLEPFLVVTFSTASGAFGHLGVKQPWTPSKWLDITLYNRFTREGIETIVLTDGSRRSIKRYEFFDFFQKNPEFMASASSIESHLTEEDEYREISLQDDVLLFEAPPSAAPLSSLSKWQQEKEEEKEPSWAGWL